VQVGDLVKMKLHTFWVKKNQRAGMPYTETPMLVYEVAHNVVKVILPNGRIKSDLKEYYEVISASR